MLGRSQKKKSLPQIGLLFREFFVGPKKTKATVLKLLQEKGSLERHAGMFEGQNFCLEGVLLPPLLPPLVAAL